MKLPFIPADAPFSVDQKAWLGGFLAGLHSRKFLESAAPIAAAKPATRLDILYGTQTGNAESVALDAAASAKAKGFDVVVQELDAVNMSTLASMQRVIVAVSTYGEGEMPDNAQMFWDALSAADAPPLPALQFAVLALGDTGYDDFCEAGKLIDARFDELGAERLIDRLDCDIDYEDIAEEWVHKTLSLVGDSVESTVEATAKAVTRTSIWNRKNPYPANVKVNRLLSAQGSDKEIRHFEIDLGESGLDYQAGDALNVMPINAPTLVTSLLERLGFKYDAAVAGFDRPLGYLLTNNFEISTPSRDMIVQIEQRAGDDELSHIVDSGDKEAMDGFLWGKDIFDLLNINPRLTFDADQFVAVLKPLQHRAYSISSSPKMHPGEVHLTVAAVRWHSENRDHSGVCSTFLSDRVAEGERAGVFVSPNNSFRVPDDDDAPMIMVGPGTGIAPFRAFLEERQKRYASGDNWLFFGDQHRATDFLYEDELEAMQQADVLTRLDVTFSRDQSEKLYVQSKMHEHGSDLFAWLERGGYFYICGDATRMAKDVDEALREIIAEHGQLSDDAASDYLNGLKRAKRYQRDVY